MMKRIVFPIICLLFFLMTTTAVLAEPTFSVESEKNLLPTITVYGTATIEVVPDEMYWSVKILNRGPDTQALAEKHQERVKEFLNSLGKNVEEIQTSMMQFNENWTHVKGESVLDGYYASTTVSFKLLDFKKYGLLWGNIANTPGGSIQNISYGYAKQKNVQMQAKIKALKAAKEKARLMSQALNENKNSISKTPYLIEEIPDADLTPNTIMARASFAKVAGSEVQAFSLGKIKIKSQVRVVYLLAAPQFD